MSKNLEFEQSPNDDSFRWTDESGNYHQFLKISNNMRPTTSTQLNSNEKHEIKKKIKVRN